MSAALAVAAARRGLSTIVAEIAGQSDVAAALGGEPAHRDGEVELAPNLHHVAIEREAALEEYLRAEVPGLLPASILARSRVFGLFVDAAPGLAELLTIGKVWELVQDPRHSRGARVYDQVILDGPASGQLLGLLGSPLTFSSIARAGPVAHQGEAIDRMLRDPDAVAIVAVTTAEQMAVSETLILDNALDDQLGRRLDGVVVNRMFPQRFSAAEARAFALAAEDPAVRSAAWFHQRAQSQRTQLRRLERGMGDKRRLRKLPFIFTGALSPADVARLGDQLQRARRSRPEEALR